MKQKMSINQKLELSREIRQWVGIGVRACGVALSAYVFVPGFKNVVDDTVNRIKFPHLR